MKTSSHGQFDSTERGTVLYQDQYQYSISRRTTLLPAGDAAPSTHAGRPAGSGNRDSMGHSACTHELDRAACKCEPGGSGTVAANCRCRKAGGSSRPLAGRVGRTRPGGSQFSTTELESDRQEMLIKDGNNIYYSHE